VTTKQWKLVVTPLSGTTPLHQFEFEGGNWLAALRDARQELGEDGGLPSGASCTVAPDGTVTILDPEARRKFLLTPISRVPPAPTAGSFAEASAVQPRPGGHAVVKAGAAKPKFQTVAYSPPRGPAVAAQPVAPPPAALPPGPATSARVVPDVVAQEAIRVVSPPSTQARAAEVSRTPVKRVDTADYEDPTRKKPLAGSGITTAAVTSAGVGMSPRTGPELELLLSRDAEPTAENPLIYRERAYLVPRGVSVTDVELALRASLTKLQQALDAAPRGKLINLAAFDHSWTDRPQKPPLVAIEWRDWRGDPVVDYPAAEEAAGSPQGAEPDERLAVVFESLHELSHLRTAAEGLDFTVRLLGQTVACDAMSACLYDINTDELRFVAVAGMGARSAQGKAIARSAGLFSKAAALEHASLVINDMQTEPSYEPHIDGRAGVPARNMLLRAVTHDGRLLGMLQLINRSSGFFTGADVHLTNYVAERLAEFLREARARVRA